MAIIIKQGKKAHKVKSETIQDEAYLQNYIHDNPDTLPLDDIKDNLKLLSLAEEFPTDSGPIDALGVDSDGDIYIIETKLYRNSDKRLVVAQMLDYGAALWHGFRDLGQFTAQLESMTNSKLKGGLTPTLREVFNLDEQGVATILQNIEQNLSHGRFRFVVLMDEMESRLKTLITFINANSNFRVLGCELEFYRHDDFDIIIPHLYGNESVAASVRSGSNPPRKKWTRQMYDEELAKIEPRERRERIRELISVAEKHADVFLKPTVGTGLTGSLSFYDPIDYRVFSIYLNGKLDMVIDSQQSSFSAIGELVKKFEGRLGNLAWSRPLETGKINYPVLASPVEQLTPDAFVALKEFLLECATLRAKKNAK